MTEMEMPDVSVVIPAWNCGDVLPAQLEALSAQDFAGAWEVVVADNGSTDATAAVIRDFCSRDPRLRYVDAGARRGASAARNDGVAAARAEKILFCDADDVVASDWVRLMAEALDESTATGGWLSMFVNRPGDIEAPGRSAVAPFGTANFVISASMGIRREVFDETGGFDETWGPGEDIDLCLRLLRLGHSFDRVDAAVVHKRVTTEPKAVWRQHYRYGVQRARAAAAFPEYCGSRGLRQAVKKWAWMVVKLPLGWRDRDVLGPSAMAVGRLVGSVRYRTIYL